MHLILIVGAQLFAMPNNRRLRHAGNCFFFTVNLADRNSDFLTENADLIRAAYCATQRTLPFHCDAFVLLPDHLHAVWTLPDDDYNTGGRWALFKSYVSRRVTHAASRPCSKAIRREKGLWQRRFWEHGIEDEDDFRKHVEYCWGNPIKHGFVTAPGEWPFSSIHRDMKRGLVAPEWRASKHEGAFGERPLTGP